MSNLSKSASKFLKNKNTVTVLGVIICFIVLIIGYNVRINQKTELVKVYYANQTIQPKTKITIASLTFAFSSAEPIIN